MTAGRAPTPGEIYEREMVPAIFSRWAPDLVAAAGVKSGERALDVARGTGVVTRLLADRVGARGRVVGLDAIAAEVAEQTRAYVDDEGWATPQVTHILQAVV